MSGEVFGAHVPTLLLTSLRAGTPGDGFVSLKRGQREAGGGGPGQQVEGRRGAHLSNASALAILRSSLAPMPRRWASCIWEGCGGLAWERSPPQGSDTAAPPTKKIKPQEGAEIEVDSLSAAVVADLQQQAEDQRALDNQADMLAEAEEDEAGSGPCHFRSGP